MARAWAGAASLAILLVATTLAVLATPVNSVAVEPSPGTLTVPTAAYGATVVDGEGYLFGGTTDTEAYTDRIQVIREDGSSHQVGTLPGPLRAPAAASTQGVAYLFGGASEGPGDLPVMTRDVHRYDPASGQASEVQGANLPEAMADGSAATYDGKIYIFGGLSLSGGVDSFVLDYKDSISVFNPAGESLNTLSVNLPSPRAQMAAVATEDGILLLGGRGDNNEEGTVCPNEDQASCLLDEILFFDPEEQTVRVLNHLPDPTRWATAAMEDGRVYLLGGCGPSCGPYSSEDSIYEIDPETGEATELPVRMPNKGGRRVALPVGDVTYVPGGEEPNAEGSGWVIGGTIHAVELGITRPWAPGGLTVEGTAEGAQLSWEPPAYDGSGELVSYIVYRARGSGETTELTELSAPAGTHLDTTAEIGATYTYQVAATNEAGLSARSGTAVTTITQTPGPPTVSAQGGNEKLFVQWTPPRETGGLAIEEYRIWAGTDPTNLTAVATSTGRYFEITEPLLTVENGQTYHVAIDARNGNGWGTASQPVSAQATDAPAPPGAPSATPGTVGGQRVVNLTWEPSPTPEVTGYIVHRGTSLDNLTAIDETQGTALTDDGELPSGTIVYYAVSAVSEDGQGPISQVATVSFATPPSQVRFPDARWTGTGAMVWWESPSDLGGGELEGYEIARTTGAIDPEEAGANVTPVDTHQFTDPDPPRGKTSVYHIRAVGTGGPGPWATAQVRVPLGEDSTPPVPALSANPSTAPAGTEVLFDASDSSDDEAVVAYQFDFGDGTATGWRSDPQVTHTYQHPGVYTAKLQVRDMTGLNSGTPAEVIMAIGRAPPEEGEDEHEHSTHDHGENGAPVSGLAALVALGAAAAALKRRG